MTEMETVCEVSVSNGIATLTFGSTRSGSTSWPNSLPTSLLERMAQRLRELNQDPRVRVIILKPKGERFFCTGANVDEMLERAAEGDEAFFGGFAPVYAQWAGSPKQTIAVVSGGCFGGGLGLARGAKWVIGVERVTTFRLSELDLGILPAVVSMPLRMRLHDKVFLAMALDREVKDAAWAMKVGLLTHCVSPEALEDTVAELAAQLAAEPPQLPELGEPDITNLSSGFDDEFVVQLLEGDLPETADIIEQLPEVEGAEINPEAVAELLDIVRKPTGTDDILSQMQALAQITGRCSRSEQTQRWIKRMQAKRKK